MIDNIDDTKIFVIKFYYIIYFVVIIYIKYIDNRTLIIYLT